MTLKLLGENLCNLQAEGFQRNDERKSKNNLKHARWRTTNSAAPTHLLSLTFSKMIELWLFNVFSHMTMITMLFLLFLLSLDVIIIRYLYILLLSIILWLFFFFVSVIMFIMFDLDRIDVVHLLGLLGFNTFGRNKNRVYLIFLLNVKFLLVD